MSNWATQLKDRVVKYFEEKKKKEEESRAYIKQQLERSKQAKAKKKKARDEPVMKGRNPGTKKVISDLKKSGMTDKDIEKLLDK
jgi:uncharacterized Rossmann fold enzyme